MPLATLHLISLNPQTTLSSFLRHLKSSDVKPITVSKVIRWIITPSSTDKEQLLEPLQPYELLLILPHKQSPSSSSNKPNSKPQALPGPLEAQISSSFTLTIAIPSRLLTDYTNTNARLLHPSSPASSSSSSSSVPSLSDSLKNPSLTNSSQDLTLSTELNGWITKFASSTNDNDNNKKNSSSGAVSMLNLLSFKPGMRESYIKYGKAFAGSIGSRRGGNAKLVGHVVYNDDDNESSPPSSGGKEGNKWDEFALAHYPSILHFADMLASKDYQDVNQRYRVPALKDTCILFTSEIEVEDILAQEDGAKAKL